MRRKLGKHAVEAAVLRAIAEKVARMKNRSRNERDDDGRHQRLVFRKNWDLAQQGFTNMNGVASELEISAYRLHHVLNRLHRAGLIDRASSHDRGFAYRVVGPDDPTRKQFAGLTDKGAARIGQSSI